MTDTNDLQQYSGRGRPRVDNPLSAADRAKAYRERKKAGQQVKCDGEAVTNNDDTLPSYGMLESRIILLTAENLQLAKKLQDVQRAEEHRTMSLMSAHAEIRAFCIKIAELEAQIKNPKSKAKK
jgi:hypothetical protein